MALRIRFRYESGNQLVYTIERLSDGLFYDFSSGTFLAAPTTPTATLPEDAGIYRGRYKATLDPTPVASFTDGDYVVTVIDRARLSANEPAVVEELATLMIAGDDATPGPAELAGLVLKALDGKQLTTTLTLL